MSKFLKGLDILIFIVALLAGAALLVPPVFGIDAVVVENNAASNVDKGSVIYAMTVEADGLSAGDKIVITGENDSVNVYQIDSYNGDQHIVSASKAGEENEMIDVGSYVSKALVIIPFLGFLRLAVESMTGLMILGGCVLVWIILLILSIVLDKDYEDDDDEEEYFKTLSQEEEKIQKKNDEKEFPVDGEGEDFIKNLKDAVSGRETESYQVISVDNSDLAAEIKEEEALVEQEEAKEEQKEIVPPVAVTEEQAIPEEDPVISELAEFLNGGSSSQAKEEKTFLPEEEKEPAKKDKAVPEEKDMGTEELPDVQAALEAALENQQISYSRKKKETAEVEQTEEQKKIASGEIELAIPAYSVDELLEKARKDGYEPKVREDKTTGIKLVDYSDIL